MPPFGGEAERRRLRIVGGIHRFRLAVPRLFGEGDALWVFILTQRVGEAQGDLSVEARNCPAGGVHGKGINRAIRMFLLIVRSDIFQLYRDGAGGHAGNAPQCLGIQFHRKYLQIKYTLTSSGKIIKRINPARVTAMRRKLKKLAVKVETGETSYVNVEDMFRSWMGNYYKLLSNQQRTNLITLFEELFHKTVTIVNKKMVITEKADSGGST